MKKGYKKLQEFWQNVGRKKKNTPEHSGEMKERNRYDIVEVRKKKTIVAERDKENEIITK